MSADAALRTLLGAGARFDAEYRGGLLNHLPMAPQALHALGADAELLQAFAAVYEARLDPAPAHDDSLADADFELRLGQVGAWPAYRTLFARRLQRAPRAAVLAQVLPLPMPGCGAAAFHGLIRAAHAVASGDFTVLHLVIGRHALRALLPYIAAPQCALHTASPLGGLRRRGGVGRACGRRRPACAGRPRLGGAGRARVPVRRRARNQARPQLPGRGPCTWPRRAVASGG